MALSWQGVYFVSFGFISIRSFVVVCKWCTSVDKQTERMKWNIGGELNEREYLIAMIEQKNRLNHNKRETNFIRETGEHWTHRMSLINK